MFLLPVLAMNLEFSVHTNINFQSHILICFGVHVVSAMGKITNPPVNQLGTCHIE